MGPFDNLVKEDLSTSKSIFEILSKIEWEQINQAENLVEQFLKDAQIYFDQAQHAVTKQKERELLKIVYTAIKKVDRVIGLVEIKANTLMREQAELFVSGNIKHLVSTFNISKEKVIPQIISLSSADLTPTQTVHNEDYDQNQVNQIIDLHIEEVRTKFDRSYKEFVSNKMS